MENKQFGRELEYRTRRFAVNIIKMTAILPNTAESRVIRNQITKSGTSIGANYREANRARSRAGFRNKIRLCESEASETQYWFEIVDDMDWISKEALQTQYKECSELLALFTSIAKKCLRHNNHC